MGDLSGDLPISIEDTSLAAGDQRQRAHADRQGCTAGRLITPVLARMIGRRLATAFANTKRVLEVEASAVRMDDRV